MEHSGSRAKQLGELVGGGIKPLAESRKSIEKRAAIIRAAIAIINAKSYALATMTEIAASLDLRDATLYYYFSNKQALAFACHVQSFEQFEAFIIVAEADGMNGQARLEGFIRQMLHDANVNGQQLYFGDYAYLNAAQRTMITTRAAQLTSKLEQFIKDGVSDGSIVACESGLVVNLVLGMLIWLAKWAPAVSELTVGRLMSAIELVTFKGLSPSFHEP